MIWLEINRADGAIERRDVFVCDGQGVAVGACPGCNIKPFAIKTVTAPEAIDDRTYRAGSRCAVCHDAVGFCYETETLFGIEEDTAILKHGRPRVYS